MKKNSPVNYALYGETRPPFRLLPDFMHCEPIADRSSRHNWVIEPHQHGNLFQIFVITSGKAQFFCKGQTLALEGPYVLSIPENTPHGFELSSDTEGKVLTLSQSYIETLFHDAPNVLLEMGDVRILSDVAEHRRFELIERIVHRLYEELSGDLPEKKLALQSYFSLLLTEVFRLSLEKSAQTQIPDKRSARYFQAFQQAIKKTPSPKTNICEHARALGITPVHLNRVCRQIAGKSALQTLQEHLITEAVRYLKHTDYSVSEIAYRLNFEDPAYFSRLFKKQIGVSPRAFRGRPERV